MNKTTQEKFIYAIDGKIVEAGKIMGMEDLTDEESEDSDIHDTVYEQRFHCGVCIVSTVMETVWPSVDKYLDYLEGTIRGYEAITESSHTALKSILPSLNKEQQEVLISTMATLNTAPEPLATDKDQPTE